MSWTDTRFVHGDGSSPSLSRTQPFNIYKGGQRPAVGRYIYITTTECWVADTIFFILPYNVKNTVLTRPRLLCTIQDKVNIIPNIFPIFFLYPVKILFRCIPFHSKWWKVETGNLLAESFFLFICRQEELRRCEMNWFIYFPHRRRHIPPPLVLIENNKISIGDLFDMKKKIGNGFDGDNSDTRVVPESDVIIYEGAKRQWSFQRWWEREREASPSFFSIVLPCRSFWNFRRRPYRAIYQLLYVLCSVQRLHRRESLSLNIYSEHLTSFLCMHESPSIIIISLSLYPFTLSFL